MPVNRQVFLCHANEDKEQVRVFYHRLKAEGFDPWLDEENLLPGQNWEEEIPHAIRTSAAVVVFLSKTSIRKKGYVQREFKLAYDALQEIPEGQVFVIPVKIDDCAVPPSFQKLQWISTKSCSGFDKVIQSLRTQNGEKNDATYMTEQLQIGLQRHHPYLKEKLEKLEEAVEILSKLTRECSQTSSFIMWSMNMTQEEYHKAYLETTDLDRLRTIISVYFNQFIDLFEHFSGATNIFFGHQQRLLYQSQQLGVHHVATQNTNNEVVKAAHKVEETSNDLMQRLASEALALNQRLQATQ